MSKLNPNAQKWVDALRSGNYRQGHSQLKIEDRSDDVTSSVNARRGNTMARMNSLKTHCKRGHEFTATNTILIKGKYRNCRACRIQGQRAYRRAHGSR